MVNALLVPHPPPPPPPPLPRAVARSLLEKVDRYLWSRQPSALSPQLQLVEEREREARRSGDFPSEQQVVCSCGGNLL